MLVLTACVQRLLYPLVLAPVSLLQRSGLEPRPATAVHFVLLLFLVVLCFFVVPAAIFTKLEESWSFLDGVYFCFISLCTIGLGDFVPGMQPEQKYRTLYLGAVMGESVAFIQCTQLEYSHGLNQVTAQINHIVKVIFGSFSYRLFFFLLASNQTDVTLLSQNTDFLVDHVKLACD